MRLESNLRLCTNGTWGIRLLGKAAGVILGVAIARSQKLPRVTQNLFQQQFDPMNKVEKVRLSREMS
jgi:hypothetical protein